MKTCRPPVAHGPALFLAAALIALALPATEARPDHGDRFGDGLDPSRQAAQAEARPEYARPPLTVDCWAKLESRARFNILVAQGPKESAAHWELYTTAGTGSLAAYVPGAEPAILDSKADVCDGKWHACTLIYEADRVRLFVDARAVLDAPIRRGSDAGEPGPLWFGAYPPQSIGCDGQLDEVWIRRGAFAPEAVPAEAFAADEATIGLWHFDEAKEEKFADSSKLDNPAIVGIGPGVPPEFREGAEPSYRTADPSLKVVRLDRSLDESFIAVRLDTMGRIFVGGREAVFVYEPDEHGGYGDCKELFRFPAHSWVGDIAIRGDDLYVATAAAIYRLPGARSKREGITAEKLVWGAPVDLHVTYHGLAFGPQGDLFFNAGDPLLNYGDFRRPDHWGHWTVFNGPEATATPYTGVGGVFRVGPDGEGFRVVAGGLRGTDGLTFDKRYELYTNDNDHESIPDRYTPYRLLHVTPHANFSWPRGWTARRSPDRADLLEIANPGLGRGVPVGQSYYGDRYLPEPYRDALLVAQWGHRMIEAAPIQPRGASFAVEERPLLVAEGRARPVGVTVGRGGRVFATIAYMAQNEGSPTYPSELVMITQEGDPAEHPFEPYDAPTVSADRLWSELSNPSWSRRDPAHREILRRGGDLLVMAIDRLRNLQPDDPARPHLAWLAGASGQPEAGQLLTDLARGNDSAMRLQAVRALAEFPMLGAATDLFTSALDDDDPRVQLAALNALFDRDGRVPEAVVALARSEDTYLRQSASKLLAARASREELAGLLHSEDPATRLAGVLAVGFRLTVPKATAAIPEALPLKYESGNAMFTIPYADGVVNLRNRGRVGSFTMAERWGSVAHSEEEEQLFTLLTQALDDSSDRVRLQSGYFLSLLNDARSELLVAKATGEILARRLAATPPKPVAEIWRVGPFLDGNMARPIEGGPIDLSARFASDQGEIGWARDKAANGTYRLEPAGGAVSYAYFRLQSGASQRANLLVRSDDAVKVWQNGRPVYENAVGSIRGFRNVTGLDLVPGSNDLLIRLRQRPGGSMATIEVQSLANVMIELPEDLGIAGLADRLKASSGSGDAIPPEFLTIDWSKAVRQGDRERGRKLFSADGIGCVKCHAIAPGEAGGGAPSLADAGKRFTVSHLIESVLDPARQVAPVFQGTLVATIDGRVISGLVVNETADAIELLLPDATHSTIAKALIDDRRPMEGSPMPSGLVKSPDELRDLAAFLLGEGVESP